jgi:hypothetical protein
LAVESALKKPQVVHGRITMPGWIDSAASCRLSTDARLLPGALLSAQEASTQTGLGRLLVVDGDATTDVHSIGYGQATGPQIVERVCQTGCQTNCGRGLGHRFNAGTLLIASASMNLTTHFALGFRIRVSRDEMASLH